MKDGSILHQPPTLRDRASFWATKTWRDGNHSAGFVLDFRRRLRLVVKRNTVFSESLIDRQEASILSLSNNQQEQT